MQFAHYLSEKAQRELRLPTKPQVFVRTMISLNLRPPQPFIDPHLDLVTVKRPLIGHQSWIVPLKARTSRPHQHPSPQEVNRSGSASAG